MGYVDRRQFIISDKKVKRENFTYRELEPGRILSYEKTLPVQDISGGVLIGIAFPIDNEYPVAEDNGHLLEERMKRWSGRFIVYASGRIYTDAINSLGLFYLCTQKGWVVSSSMHVLAEEYNLKRNSDELLYGQSGKNKVTFFSDFFPGPFTPVAQIRRLMIYEYLDYNSEMFVNKRCWDWNPLYRGLTADELSCKLIDYCKCLYKNIEEEYDGIHIALTGGMDSRTCAALAKYAGVNFDTFTEKRSYKTHMVKTLHSELETAKKVAVTLGVKWKLCKNNYFDVKKYNDVTTHTYRMLKHATIFSYAYSQYPDRIGKDIILHSSVWEGLIEYLKNKIGTAGPTVKERKRMLEYVCPYMQTSEVHCKSLNQWVEDIEVAGCRQMSFTDRCMFEQRECVWASDLSQLSDIEDFDRIELINSHELLSILIAYPKEMLNKKKLHEINILSHCYPKLLDIPINQKSKVETFWECVRKNLWSLKQNVRHVLGNVKRKLIRKAP